MGSPSWAGFEPVAGLIALPFWAAGALAACFLFACAVALTRDGPIQSMRILVASVLVAACGLFALAIVQGQGVSRNAQGAMLAARVMDLNTRAIAQSSPLGCLTGPMGEAVEAACEKSLFATPEMASSALAFVEMQIAILAQASQAAVADAPAMAGLRRAVETDRYGLAAKVFMLRFGCAGDQCPAFAMMTDSTRVRAHIKARKYEAVVARHAAAWPAGPAPVVLSSTRNAPSPTLLSGVMDPGTVAATTGLSTASPAVAAPPASGSTTEIDYPSAASIPAVSIMNAEPAKAAPRAAAAPVPRPAAASSQRRTAAAGEGAATSGAAQALPPPLNLQQ